MASLLLGRRKSSFYNSHLSDLVSQQEETPFLTSSSEVPPHRRHMKKQVSFDSPPCAIKTITDNLEDDAGEDQEKVSGEENSEQENTVRSYQRDLMEFYKDAGAVGHRGSVPSVPIIPTLEGGHQSRQPLRSCWECPAMSVMLQVMPPKPGSSRLSRKDKQGGWSLPKKEKIFSNSQLSSSSLQTRSRSRTVQAVERFFYNLTRPTDQRNQPIPKRPSRSEFGGERRHSEGKGKMKASKVVCWISY